jgi:DNA invertase Pin-like site-specific DNA recombinase
VSTKEQAERDGDPEGYSIPAQRDANLRKAAALGATVIEEFVDRGESARSAARPELQRMLAYVREHRVQYCIVHKVDRLARNRADDVEINLALTKAGVRLVSATENIDESPSGMLLHGIMSSIAEFYSRNLANEVLKGMTQKASSGGTVSRAPLGYRNVRRLDEVGREVRYVEVDLERAALIRYAFERYAEGDVSLRALAEDLGDRGLTTLATPKRASKPITPTGLHKFLTNPYYKGQVVYREVAYNGRHAPIVDEVLWQQVQSTLTSNLTGEKTRVHPHYLKGTVYCGKCGSRLIVTFAKNRYGVVYEYFVCLGRHQKRTTCQLRAIPIDILERTIEEHYKTVALKHDERVELDTRVAEDLDHLQAGNVAEESQLLEQRRALQTKREKLLEAHFNDAIPVDLLRDEQAKITTVSVGVEHRLRQLALSIDDLRKNASAAFDLAENCSWAYERAAPRERRLLNQAIFERIYVIDEDHIKVTYAQPFELLLGDRTAQGIAPNKNADSTGSDPDPYRRHFVGAGSKELLLVDPRVSGFTT